MIQATSSTVGGVSSQWLLSHRSTAVFPNLTVNIVRIEMSYSLTVAYIFEIDPSVFYHLFNAKTVLLYVLYNAGITKNDDDKMC